MTFPIKSENVFFSTTETMLQAKKLKDMMCGSQKNPLWAKKTNFGPFLAKMVKMIKKALGKFVLTF